MKCDIVFGTHHRSTGLSNGVWFTRLLQIALALVFACGSVIAQTPTVADIAKNGLPSVVSLAAKDPTGKTFGTGSGFVASDDGLIITNRHVIERATSVSVTLSNGDVYDDVLVVDEDARRDIVILAIKAFKLRALVLGDSDVVTLGQHVVAIGNPLRTYRHCLRWDCERYQRV